MRIKPIKVINVKNQDCDLEWTLFLNREMR